MINVAVLGLGSIGLRHARNLLALGAKVIGADPDPARRALLLDLGGRAVAARDEALTEAEGVVIASPSLNHHADLAACIGAGCHVLVEKPLSHTTDGLNTLLAQAEARGLAVLAGLNLRFHPAVRAARDAIHAGRIGNPLWARLICSSYLPDWRPHQDYRKGYAADTRSGGVLFDNIHEIDLANFLLGQGELATAAVQRSGVIDLPTEDMADLVLRHDGGVQSSIHLDYVSRPRLRLTEVAGSEGRLTLDLDRRHLLRRDISGQLAEETEFPGGYDTDYVDEMRDFLNAIAGGVAIGCGGREAMAVLRQVLAARKACGLPE